MVPLPLPLPLPLGAPGASAGGSWCLAGGLRQPERRPLLAPQVYANKLCLSALGREREPPMMASPSPDLWWLSSLLVAFLTICVVQVEGRRRFKVTKTWEVDG